MKIAINLFKEITMMYFTSNCFTDEIKSVFPLTVFTHTYASSKDILLCFPLTTLIVNNMKKNCPRKGN